MSTSCWFTHPVLPWLPAGVHTWNLAGSNGGTGILLHSGAGATASALAGRSNGLTAAEPKICSSSDCFASCSTDPLRICCSFDYTLAEYAVDRFSPVRLQLPGIDTIRVSSSFSTRATFIQ
eukprot:535679-Pleurochrysis_carterae.AAC.2